MLKFSNPGVEQFFQTYNITDFTVNSDESRLIFSSNLNGKVNLWAIDFPNYYPYQFSELGEACNFIRIDKQKRFVLAGFDHDGDENYQIFALPYNGGVPQPFVTGEKSDKFYFSKLSEDGKRLYYVTSIENPSFLNTRVRDLESGADTLLHKGEKGPTELVDVSEDEKSFIFIQIFANTYNNAYVQHEGEWLSLTPDPEKVHIVSDALFVNNTTIYFVTNFEKEYSYIAKYDIAKQIFSPVVEVEKEGVISLKWEKNTNSLYFTTENGVQEELYRYALETGELTKLASPVKVVEKIVVTESGNLYLLGRSAVEPLNIFRSADGASWERITSNQVLGVPKEMMVDPDVITYKSYDGMEIEALLFKAKPEYANGYTIFWPHGGPQWAERKMFRAMFQCFLNQGYTIFAPNFRGSTGYGSSFVKLVERDWGEGPRLDCVAGIEWLISQGITNPDKLFLVGGSYGGYMALLLHGRHPEYFKAVVDLFGPSNLFSFLNSVPEHWKPMMDQWLGDAERDKERLTKDSPITYLDQMVKPMFVIQGANDPRVVKKESDQIVAVLKEKGRDVEYLVLDDEGHGFSKKENEIKVYKQMLEFLRKHQ
ncbi:S9 family peptidase [Bacillaceae bacterium Marseille-Q3522]|nr:S9 family peptidase [Bacillaceae bacterium Marseille-Q3522]